MPVVWIWSIHPYRFKDSFTARKPCIHGALKIASLYRQKMSDRQLNRHRFYAYLCRFTVEIGLFMPIYADLCRFMPCWQLLSAFRTFEHLIASQILFSPNRILRIQIYEQFTDNFTHFYRQDTQYLYNTFSQSLYAQDTHLKP